MVSFIKRKRYPYWPPPIWKSNCPPQIINYLRFLFIYLLYKCNLPPSGRITARPVGSGNHWNGAKVHDWRKHRRVVSLPEVPKEPEQNLKPASQPQWRSEMWDPWENFKASTSVGQKEPQRPSNVSQRSWCFTGVLWFVASLIRILWRRYVEMLCSPT